MFSRSSKPTPPNAMNDMTKGQAKGKSAPPSVISSDMKIVGNLKSQGETQIDGVVDGDIHSHVLLIGESAKVKGEVIAEVVRIHGTVTGEIKAKAVILASTAHVVGNILHGNITIEKGAHLEGHLTRMEDDKAGASSDSRINLVAGASAPSGAGLGATTSVQSQKASPAKS